MINAPAVVRILLKPTDVLPVAGAEWRGLFCCLPSSFRQPGGVSCRLWVVCIGVGVDAGVDGRGGGACSAPLRAPSPSSAASERAASPRASRSSPRAGAVSPGPPPGERTAVTAETAEDS